MMQEEKELENQELLLKVELSESIPELNGLVLVGGESSRMGKDKSTIEYHGLPQSDFMVNLMGNYVSKVYLSCHPDRVPQTNHPVITDTFLDLGPYGGVLSAFRHDPKVAWLVVACDLPMLDDSILSQLMTERDPSKVATCFHDPSTGAPEPLIAIWEPRAYPILLQFLSQGFSNLRQSLIDTDSKQIHNVNAQALKNANTPEEVLKALQLLQEKDAGEMKIV